MGSGTKFKCTEDSINCLEAFSPASYWFCLSIIYDSRIEMSSYNLMQ
jgi:hypothetical protein